MRKARSSFSYFPEGTSFRQLCHSSFGGPWPGMTPKELDALRADIFQQAEFCAIRILAFSLLPKSFDLLLEVPTKPRLTKKDMLARVEANLTAVLAGELLPALRRNDADAWQRVEGYFGSVAVLLKRIKHKAAIRYHQQRGSSGTLWNSRFDATLVEPGHASRVVAAWIDHTSARETPATLPEEYPFCTIGAAVSGNPAARAMIRKVFSNDETADSWRTAFRSWRDFRDGEPEHPKPPRAGTAGTLLNRRQLMLHPLPHFHGGLAIGTQDFVERLFEHNAHHFGGERSTGARFLVGQNDPGLFTLRDKGDLRKPPRSKRGRLPG